MDMGHYHPTEAVHDKLSSALAFMPEVLLHISRPVRWDSDHVVILNDDLENLAREIVRGRAIGEVYLATDFLTHPSTASAPGSSACAVHRKRF